MTEKLKKKPDVVDAEIVEEAPPPATPGFEGGVAWNEISSNSHGGTETMARRLERSLPRDLLKEFQIILSRVRDIDESRLRVYYLHDLPPDPESRHLKDEGWRRFHKIVFVSHWQRDAYVREYEIPFSRTAVIRNAIEPIKLDTPKPDPNERINFIYTSTPHRGLELLVPVFERICEKYDNLHLDVYSSFGLYGWDKRDEPYKPVFEKIGNHPNMTYHGYKPNEVVREALAKAHVFAYPSIWQETSCLCLIEAMSAKCVCVHSDLAALPETAANWTVMYPYDERVSVHASHFHSMVEGVIHALREDRETVENKMAGQKSYTDLFYNWEMRKLEWENLLRSLLDEPRGVEKSSGPYFHYSVPY